MSFRSSLFAIFSSPLAALAVLFPVVFRSLDVLCSTLLMPRKILRIIPTSSRIHYHLPFDMLRSRFHSLKKCTENSHFSHAKFCIALFALSALSPSIVQIVQKVQSDFLHDQLDKVPLPVGQVGQLCHANFCMAILTILAISPTSPLSPMHFFNLFGTILGCF